METVWRSGHHNVTPPTSVGTSTISTNSANIACSYYYDKSDKQDKKYKISVVYQDPSLNLQSVQQIIHLSGTGGGWGISTYVDSYGGNVSFCSTVCDGRSIIFVTDSGVIKQYGPAAWVEVVLSNSNPDITAITAVTIHHKSPIIFYVKSSGNTKFVIQKAVRESIINHEYNYTSTDIQTIWQGTMSMDDGTYTFTINDTDYFFVSPTTDEDDVDPTNGYIFITEYNTSSINAIYNTEGSQPVTNWVITAGGNGLGTVTFTEASNSKLYLTMYIGLNYNFVTTITGSSDPEEEPGWQGINASPIIGS